MSAWAASERPCTSGVSLWGSKNFVPYILRPAGRTEWTKLFPAGTLVKQGQQWSDKMSLQAPGPGLTLVTLGLE